MTIQQLMQDMQMSRYRLSKISGIPWSTLADIYSGKTRLSHCSAVTISRLSKALGLSIEALLELDNEPKKGTLEGKPNRKAYLETGLPESIQKRFPTKLYQSIRLDTNKNSNCDIMQSQAFVVSRGKIRAYFLQTFAN